MVETDRGQIKIKEVKIGDLVKAYDIENDKNHFVSVKETYSNRVEGIKIQLDNGKEITTSVEHKFLCEDNKMRPLREILEKNLGIVVKG